MRKTTVFFSILMTVFFVLNTAVSFALNKTVPGDALKAAKDGVADYIQDMRDNRAQYGLNADDDLNKISIDIEGYKCYTITNKEWENLKIGKTVSSISNVLTLCDIYAFPVLLGQKSIGLITVQKSKDSWNVFQMESDPNVRTYIEEAKKNITGKALDSDDVKFVYDAENGIEGFSVNDSSGDYFISIVDNQVMGLRRGVKNNLAAAIQNLVRTGPKNATEQAVSAGSDAKTSPASTSVTAVAPAAAIESTTKAQLSSTPEAASVPSEAASKDLGTMDSAKWYPYAAGAVIVIILIAVSVFIIGKRSNENAK